MSVIQKLSVNLSASQHGKISTVQFPNGHTGDVPTNITAGKRITVAPVISGEIIYKEIVLPRAWAIERNPMEIT